MSQGVRIVLYIKWNERYGRDTTIITKVKTTYELTDKKCSPNSLVKLCFSSDFFIEEADDWSDAWEYVHISVSIENQEMVDKRVPKLLKDQLNIKKYFFSFNRPIDTY